MCGPMTALAVIGGGQAVASHMAGVKKADASNKNKARLFAQAQGKVYADHNTNITDYYTRGVDAQIQWDQNAIDYSWFIASKQNEINKVVDAAFKAYETKYSKMQGNVKLAKAAERTGNTSKRIRQSIRAAYGRGVASEQAKIGRAKNKFYDETMRMLAKKQVSDRKAATMIGMEPIRGPEPAKPVWDKGPGLFSLLTNVAMGVTTGRMAGYSAKHGSLKGFKVI